jgi:hypothetical protein
MSFLKTLGAYQGDDEVDHDDGDRDRAEDVLEYNGFPYNLAQALR